MNTEKTFIYQVCWFETKQHRIPHTTMYYMTAEETEEVFNTYDYAIGLVRVELIRTHKCTQEYSMALSTHAKKIC